MNKRYRQGVRKIREALEDMGFVTGPLMSGLDDGLGFLAHTGSSRRGYIQVSAEAVPHLFNKDDPDSSVTDIEIRLVPSAGSNMDVMAMRLRSDPFELDSRKT